MMRQIVRLHRVGAARDALARADFDDVEVRGLPLLGRMHCQLAVAGDKRRDLGLEGLIPLQEADELERLLAGVDEAIVAADVHQDRVSGGGAPQRRVYAAGPDRCDTQLGHFALPMVCLSAFALPETNDRARC